MITVLLNLCLLRSNASPNQLPFSKGLLYLFISLYFLVCYWTFSQVTQVLLTQEHLSVDQMAFPIALIKSIASIGGIAVLVGLIYVFLNKRNKTNRLLKILLAWFGTDIIIELIGVILPSYAIFEMAILLWDIFIKANILKISLETTTNRALVMALALIFIHSITLVEFFWMGLHFISKS